MNNKKIADTNSSLILLQIKKVIKNKKLKRIIFKLNSKVCKIKLNCMLKFLVFILLESGKI